MDRDAFVARLFEGFAESFPDLTDELRQVVRDEIETAIRDEASLGDLRYDESGVARVAYAIETAFDRLGVTPGDLVEEE